MHFSFLTRDAYIPSTVHWKGMLRVMKFVHFTLGYITIECHQNEPLYFVQHCVIRKSSNLPFWFPVRSIRPQINCVLWSPKQYITTAHDASRCNTVSSSECYITIIPITPMVNSLIHSGGKQRHFLPIVLSLKDIRWDPVTMGVDNR